MEDQITQKVLFEGKEVKNKSAMPDNKIEAFLLEFPWVRGYIFLKDPINQVRVSRFTPGLLDYIPIKFYDPEHGLSPWTEKMYFLDEHGEMVIFTWAYTKSVKKYVVCGPLVEKQKQWIKAGRIESDKCSIVQFLKGCSEVTAHIRFVLSYFDCMGSIIVYKVPKGASIFDWINERVLTERAQFQQQTEAIDEKIVA